LLRARSAPRRPRSLAGTPGCAHSGRGGGGRPKDISTLPPSERDQDCRVVRPRGGRLLQHRYRERLAAGSQELPSEQMERLRIARVFAKPTAARRLGVVQASGAIVVPGKRDRRPRACGGCRRSQRRGTGRPGVSRRTRRRSLSAARRRRSATIALGMTKAQRTNATQMDAVTVTFCCAPWSSSRVHRTTRPATAAPGHLDHPKFILLSGV
jgi:hypothetical protein